MNFVPSKRSARLDKAAETEADQQMVNSSITYYPDMLTEIESYYHYPFSIVRNFLEYSKH